MKWYEGSQTHYVLATTRHRCKSSVLSFSNTVWYHTIKKSQEVVLYEMGSNAVSYDTFRKDSIRSMNHNTFEGELLVSVPVFISLSLSFLDYWCSVICITHSYYQRGRQLWWTWVMERWHTVSVFLWIGCSNISVLNLCFPSWSLVFMRIE